MKQKGNGNVVFWYAAIFMLGVGLTLAYGAAWSTAALGFWVVRVVCVHRLGRLDTREQIYQSVMVVGVWACAVLLSLDALEIREYHPLDAQVGEEVAIEGVVCREADLRDFNTRLHLCIDGVAGALVKVPFYPEYQYGDRIRVIGTLATPESFVNDTGRYFDYKHFLLKDNIRYVINYPEVEYISSGQGNAIKHLLFRIKVWLIKQLRTQLPEPHVSLLGGLLVGAKQAMGQQLLDNFRATGVIHIVVLSGFNITVVVYFVMSILARLGRRTAGVVSAVFILCFAIMTGAGATVVRASIMALLVILAKFSGNHAATLRMLCIAGMVMVAWNPMIVLYDPSFQLSFVATLGLLLLSPYLELFLARVPNPSWAPLRELLAATVATQIMVTPLLLWMMGTFPTYSLFANFLILATVPWVMLTGFLAAVSSLLSAQIAFVFTTMTYFILTYELWIVEIFAGLPFVEFTLPPFDLWWVAGAYTIYAIVGYWWHTRTVIRTDKQRLY